MSAYARGLVIIGAVLAAGAGAIPYSTDASAGLDAWEVALTIAFGVVGIAIVATAIHWRRLVGEAVFALGALYAITAAAYALEATGFDTPLRLSLVLTFAAIAAMCVGFWAAER